jgi:3-oxoacyl-[acyl-carrier-protein] synthase II
MRRVVITGLGAVTPLGHDVSTFWSNLIAGKRGLGPLTKFEATGLRNDMAGEVHDWPFDPSAFGLSSAPDDATQFLLTAAREALTDAGLLVSSPSPRVERGPGGEVVGAVLSTNFGGGASWESFARGDQVAFRAFAFHTALDHLCAIFGLRGPCSLLSIACASGTAAIGQAADMIRYGRADVMLAGGHDCLALSPLAGLSILRTMTTDDILPFSRNRSGTLFGEGAGIVVLEDYEHALARGVALSPLPVRDGGRGSRAVAYCEILGSWQNNNAYHLTAPDPGGKGMARVLAEAIRDAGVSPADIGYINAHGTGTEYHDPEETLAIKSVLGAHAYEIGVSSIKGATAHLMGAAGAVEAIATAKALQTGILPPTISDGVRDEECDLDYILGEAREADVSCAASISAGVGGSNACIVMCRPDGPRSEPPPASAVVITGIAPISAIGIGREDFADGLAQGRQGIRPPERLAGVANGYPNLAECLDFVVEDYLESEKTYLDRCSEFTLAAVHLALEDARVGRENLDHTRFGLCLGTAYGCLDSMMNNTERVQRKGARFASPLIFTHTFANAPTSLAAIEFNVQGPTATFCVGDVSAAAAFQYAFDLLSHGRADIILAGGVDVLSPSLLAGIRLPDGVVPGEGACLLVLERADYARARGATILAELAAVEMRVTGPAAPAVLPPLHAMERGAAGVRWGHTFGASAALAAAEAICRLDQEAEITVPDPGGQSATIRLRRS